METALTRRALLPALVVLAAACGGPKPPPTAATPPPRAPLMEGLRVAVLPVQPGGWSVGRTGGTPVDAAGLDREIARILTERAPAVRWSFPAEIERALARSPSLDIRPRAMPVGAFHRTRVTHIGDPLYGQLRQMAALVNTRYALLPVGASYHPGEAGAPGRVELAVALVDAMGGAVLWFGVLGSTPGPAGDPGHLTAVAEALARALAY